MAVLPLSPRVSGGQVLRNTDMQAYSGLLDALAGRSGSIELEGPLAVLPGTGGRYIRIPAGTTAQRPVPARAGMMRFNTILLTLEWYDGTEWIQPGTTAVVTAANLIANGDVGRRSNQVAAGNHSH